MTRKWTIVRMYQDSSGVISCMGVYDEKPTPADLNNMENLFRNGDRLEVVELWTTDSKGIPLACAACNEHIAWNQSSIQGSANRWIHGDKRDCAFFPEFTWPEGV